MKIKDIVTKLNAKVINIANEEHEITAGYAGDFLSHVMSHAPQNSAWLTVMNNVNVAGVATFANIGLIILCENTIPDDNLLLAVKSQNISIITTKLTEFESAHKLKI